MTKAFATAAFFLGVASGSALAAEPDGLVLPPGFHAGVVAEGLGSIRHMAIRDNGDIYVSTRHGRDQPSMGIIALRLGPDHKAAEIEHFSNIDQGTGIRIYKGALYAAFPNIIAATDDDAIPDEMFRIVKGTDMGWPYTYFDGARKLRLVAPEYGGDGKSPSTDGNYATPVAAFQPHRAAVLDLAFYNGNRFPRLYRSGAFLAMHGGGDVGPMPDGQPGCNMVFVPFAGERARTPVIFADGFAGPAPSDKNLKTAAYRPTGVAVGPDSALSVADSNKGRIWRISYGETPR